MTKRISGILGTAVLVILLTAFTGSALAGNGNGKDNGNSQATPAAQPAPDATAPGNSENAPGHNKDTSSTSSTANSNQAGGNQNSPTQAGVKPANNTAKSTSCVTGGSSAAATCTTTGPTSAPAAGKADASKKYGNGKTAAQIATQNGAPAGTTIYGPGNSQPHKVALCPHKKNHGGGVDVHALKSHAAKSCATTPTQSQTSMTSQNSTTSVTGSTTVKGSRTTGAGLTTASASGGVLGVTATVSSAGKSGNAPVGGVLGALTTVGSGTLPFTGFPVWVAALLAVVLIAAGLTLRRAGRATA